MLPSSSARLLGLAALAVATLSGCSSTRTASSEGAETLFGLIKPYRIEIVQGNVVTQEVMAQIQPGLGKAQVREILGTPLLTDVFHADRWDYVFTIARQGVPAQQRRVTLFFAGDKLDRIEADKLPTEREFVAAIDTKPSDRKPPVNLTAEQIAALPVPPKQDTRIKVPQGPNRDYPPLEAGRP